MDFLFPKFNIEEKSTETIYIQLASYLIDKIEHQHLDLGTRLPSVNQASREFHVSRDTVIAAYKVLLNKEMIVSHPGKGYFVNAQRNGDTKRVFLLFDAMNQYKEVLYRSFLSHLGSQYHTDIAFHYYNEVLFDTLVSNAKDKYDYYVLMPHFNVDVSKTLNKIPANRLLLLDAFPSNYRQMCSAVYQDFLSDVYLGLKEIAPKLEKYKAMHVVYTDKLQFMPNDLLAGLFRFSGEYQFPIFKEPNFDFSKIERGHCYMAFSERDLAHFLKTVMKKKWKLGEDVGLMSFDDTPLKEILAGGITTMTTDFKKMGKTAAGLIKKLEVRQIANDRHLIDRGSL